MKIENIELAPHHPRLGAINTLHVRSRELADLIREKQNDPEFKNIKGNFTIHRQKGKAIYLDLEF